MKKYLLAMMMVFCCGAAMAQNANENENESKQHLSGDFEPTWFVSLGIGGQQYYGDHNKQLSFGGRISPAVDLSVGRWFTSVVGARLAYNGISVKGATMNGSHSTGQTPSFNDHPDDGAQYLTKQKFNYMNLHADLLINATNLFFGYEEDDTFNLSPYVGLGVAHAFGTPSTTSLSLNGGFLISFKVSEAVDINVDAHGALVGDKFDGERGERRGEGVFGITIGASYRF